MLTAFFLFLYLLSGVVHVCLVLVDNLSLKMDEIKVLIRVLIDDHLPVSTERWTAAYRVGLKYRLRIKGRYPDCNFRGICRPRVLNADSR